ncbi:MFS transporter [Streptosporangium sp. NPDC048047]|uniref:MFS transporter n=1 Tax=Streptosporangium sp. NPDC048047 TaxID=3155748 RepID=UPI0034374A07
MIGRLLVCAAGAFLSIGLLIPAVPRYVTGPLDRQAGMVGVSLAVTAVAGVLARPLAGRVADRAGRRTALCAGALLLSGTSLALLAVGRLPLFLVLRGIAGIGEALAYVGLATLASDHRRPGAAINHFSVAVNAGLLTGPVIAETLYAASGFAAVWVTAAAVALGSAALGLTLPKTMSPDTESASPDPRTRLYHTSALRPGFGYLASVWGYTAISAFLPLHLAALGGSGGLHFLVYGGVLVAIRLVGHRLLATAAPTRLAVTSLLLTGTGSTLLAAWPSPAGTWCAIALIGAGQGLGLPAFLRMAVHGLPARERGSAVATTTAFFDIGFLTAALTLGALADRFGLAGGFALAGVVSAAGALLFLPVRHHEHEGAPLDRSPR